MRDSDHRLQYALRLVSSATSHGDLSLAVFELRDLYDLNHLVYHAAFVTSPSPHETPHLLTYHADWVTRYLEQGYYLIDPAEKAFRSSALPIDWSTLDHSTREVRAFYAESIRFGVGRQGLSIPIHDPFAGRGLLSFTSNISKHQWPRFSFERMGDLAIIGRYLHHRISSLAKDGPTAATNVLTKREVECVSGRAKGQECKQIAGYLEISLTSVRDHLRIACHKLNCQNTHQLVLKAASLGLIDIDGFDTYKRR